MGKAYYSEYSAHCLRLYARRGFDDLVKKSDMAAWHAAFDAMQKIDDGERDIVMEVYSERGPVRDAVYNVGLRTGWSENIIWNLLHRIEKIVAECRGLI